MLDGVIDLLDRLRGAISGLDGQAVPLGTIAAAIAAIGPAMIIAGKGISAIGGIAKVVSGLCGGIGKLAGLFAAIPAPIFAGSSGSCCPGCWICLFVSNR